jgi:hypothetical protein
VFAGYIRDTDPQMTPLPVGALHPPWSLERIYYDQDPSAAWASGAPRGTVRAVARLSLTGERVSREGYGGNDPTRTLSSACACAVNRQTYFSTVRPTVITWWINLTHTYTRPVVPHTQTQRGAGA